MPTVLLTGAKGVIGAATYDWAQRCGWAVRPFDNAIGPGMPGHGDIRDRMALDQALDDCDGVIHLAGISRVHWGEADPALCLDVNVEGTRRVVEAVLARVRQPWILFGSSREVYGNPGRLPVQEDDPIAPVNTYGQSKAEGERIMMAARSAGARIGILRFASVYGTVLDHPDRVVPAFSRRAAEGTTLHVTGAGHVFDFVHLDDTVAGICRMAELLDGGVSDLPPIHLTSGCPVSLGTLAEMAQRFARSTAPIIDAGARPFDPVGFVGDPARAEALLGWTTSISVAQGLAKLVAEFAALSRGAAQDEADGELLAV